MKVNVVGTSCTVFSRNNTSFIIDDSIIFDVPSGNYKDIIKSVNVFKDVDWIYISHLHADHCIDLYSITTQIVNRPWIKEGKLKVYGPKGLLELITNYAKLISDKADDYDIEILKNLVDFTEIYDGFEFSEGKYDLRVVEVKHSIKECYGLIFRERGGKTYGFSADTELCDGLKNILSVSDYAFVDMSNATPAPSHLCYDEFVELSKEYPNCKMFPIHTNDIAQKLAEEKGLNALQDGQILILE